MSREQNSSISLKRKVGHSNEYNVSKPMEGDLEMIEEFPSCHKKAKKAETFTSNAESLLNTPAQNEKNGKLSFCLSKYFVKTSYKPKRYKVSGEDEL